MENIFDKLQIANGEDGFVNIQFRDDKYSFAFYITKSPTGNCQVASARLFLYLLEGERRYKGLLKNCFEKLYDKSFYLGKPLLLIDVPCMYEEQVDALFQKYCVFKQQYISTNKSKMLMALIKMHDFTYNV